jgi:hypothetical protein
MTHFTYLADKALDGRLKATDRAAFEHKFLNFRRQLTLC